MKPLIIVGGGLAGSEAAWQAAQRGINVKLFEMRPDVQTGAHVGPNLAELVCSNSLGSNLPDRAPGLLKNELRQMGSLLIKCADETAIPAGGALAVDRGNFSALVTNQLKEHKNIEIIREEVKNIPDDHSVIIASGPLTSASLSNELVVMTGQDNLYFFDAISPVVEVDSINMDIAFRASRYGRGEQEDGDYINCPLNEDEYNIFVDALSDAKRISLKSFEIQLQAGVKAGMHTFFEGCLPVEILAQRGKDTLAYGPMRPVGLTDPRTGRWPHAVIQLRQDNLAGTLYNLVGFQTNLTFSEQKRVFGMIPGLTHAEFARFGQMHRNTFIFSPALLRSTLQFIERDNLFFAGQITGVEGYAGNIATGLLAGWNAARYMKGETVLELPGTTISGALCYYITHASAADFQPMKANFGILPSLEGIRGGRRNKRKRMAAYAQRSLETLSSFLDEIKINDTKCA
ncbi:MAG: methylenetetrahydrofolate--tRNA-(uracil(54)-C(5))-methyltransferase (FADH(2)-oxidizing) TrmFO [Chloroflexota bacterium]